MQTKHRAAAALFTLVTCVAWLAHLDLGGPPHGTPGAEFVARQGLEDLLRSDAVENPQDWLHAPADVDELLTADLPIAWSKLQADSAHGCTCELHGRMQEAPLEPAQAKRTDSEKRVPVTALVQRALSAQSQLLAARQADLRRWDRTTQVNFYKWFGTVDPRARQMLYRRLTILTAINQRYSTGNFRRAVPSRPGLFAFVHAQDPSKIFVDMAFINAPTLGENSRAGTISHEMSHFTIAGGTQDFEYGVTKCKQLARTNPAKALKNADNFEFFVENAR